MALVPNVKDSRWLTLEVCREFQRSKCSRTDDECKYAHPPPHVEIQNGRVTCCYDSIKGKCNRKDPPCKYLHPPQQLKEVLLQNGRNNLLLKNIQMQMMTGVPTPIIQSGLVPMVYDTGLGKPVALPSGTTLLQSGQLSQFPQLVQVHPSYAAAFQNAAAVQNASLNPFLGAQTITQLQPTALYSTLDQQTVMATAMPASGSMPTAVSNANSMPPTSSSNSSQKMLRTDRLETSSSNAAVSNSLQNHASESVLWTGSPPAANSLLSATANPYSPAAGTAIYFQPQMFEMLNPTAAGFQAAAAAAAKKRPRDPSDELFLSVGGMSAYPGTLPLVKRTALADFKSGLPVYQPSAAAATASPYQQALTAIQYQPTYVPMSLTSHPPSLQRY